jgi:hypothetical protein
VADVARARLDLAFECDPLCLSICGALPMTRRHNIVATSLALVAALETASSIGASR